MAKDWNQISSRWTRFSRDVKKKWDKLTDEEVMQVNGRREIMIIKIQEKYDLTLEEVNTQVDEWIATLR